jgi:hypothetical protein
VSNRIDYVPPIRNNILCEHCGGELEAVAHIIGSMEIAGLSEYEWRHVKTGEPTCTRIYKGRPYDGWAATRRVNEALKLRYADEDDEP